MDDNLRQVLVATVSSLGGFATGVVVARLALMHNRTLAREQAEREDAIRREQINRTDRERWLSERRALFAAYVSAVNRLLEARRPDSPLRDDDLDPTAVMRVIEGYRGEIDLIAPELADQMERVRFCLPGVIAPLDSTGDLSPIWNIEGARDAFIEAARGNLTR
jgi:hypothetical protein